MASIGDLYFTFRGDGARLKADAVKEGGKAGEAAGKSFGGKMKDALKGNLGLQIVRTLLGSELGSSLLVRPRVGGGTEAVISLPLRGR